MGVTVKLSCGGCDATVDHAGFVNNKFCSFSGRGHGFGVRRVEIDWAVPKGWCVFDPWTQATYCPKCSEELGIDVDGQPVLEHHEHCDVNDNDPLGTGPKPCNCDALEG